MSSQCVTEKSALNIGSEMPNMGGTDYSAGVVIVVAELVEEPPQANKKSINDKTQTIQIIVQFIICDISSEL
jgi:hypothetical protein